MAAWCRVFPFGDGERFCCWIFKAMDQGLHQLLRWSRSARHQLGHASGPSAGVEAAQAEVFELRVDWLFPSVSSGVNRPPGPWRSSQAALLITTVANRAPAGSLRSKSTKPAVVSHQACPWHGDALGIGRPRRTFDGSRGMARVQGSGRRAPLRN